MLIMAAAVWRRLLLIPRSIVRTAALAATIAVPLATAVFVLAGPLQSGWARRAGTPASLLGSAGQEARVLARPAGSA